MDYHSAGCPQLSLEARGCASGLGWARVAGHLPGAVPCCGVLCFGAALCCAVLEGLAGPWLLDSYQVCFVLHCSVLCCAPEVRKYTVVCGASNMTAPAAGHLPGMVLFCTELCCVLFW